MPITIGPEHRELATRADRFARDELPAALAGWDDHLRVHRPLVDAMAHGGLLGVNVPAAYGGTAGETESSLVLCLLREVLGYHAPAADSALALQGLAASVLLRVGDELQRQRYLPGLVDGSCVGAFALTEPGYGSDVLGMRTRAVEVDGGYRIDGTKTFISNAVGADLYVVFARTDGRSRGSGISAFLVERDVPGLTATADLSPTSPHPIGSLHFGDCRIPHDALLGGLGDGLRGALGTLEIFRPSVGAFAVGAATRAFDLARSHASRREMFGTTLDRLPLARSAFGEMWLEIAGARALVYHAAARRDAGQVVQPSSAMAKLAATEGAHRVVYTAQQLHGGRGILRGNEIEALFREIRASTIYEGASEVQRSIIGRHERSRAAMGDRAPTAPSDQLDAGRRQAVMEALRLSPNEAASRIVEVAKTVGRDEAAAMGDADRWALIAIAAERSMPVALDITMRLLGSGTPEPDPAATVASHELATLHQAVAVGAARGAYEAALSAFAAIQDKLIDEERDLLQDLAAAAVTAVTAAELLGHRACGREELDLLVAQAHAKAAWDHVRRLSDGLLADHDVPDELDPFHEIRATRSLLPGHTRLCLRLSELLLASNRRDQPLALAD